MMRQFRENRLMSSASNRNNLSFYVTQKDRLQYGLLFPGGPRIAASAARCH